jgi:hypothetical protein
MVFSSSAMQFPKIRRSLAGFTTESMPFCEKGDDGGGDTPLPIPNREVKPASADGTAGETLWESRSSPIFLSYRLQLMFR